MLKTFGGVISIFKVLVLAIFVGYSDVIIVHLATAARIALPPAALISSSCTLLTRADISSSSHWADVAQKL